MVETAGAGAVERSMPPKINAGYQPVSRVLWDGDKHADICVR